MRNRTRGVGTMMRALQGCQMCLFAAVLIAVWTTATRPCQAQEMMRVEIRHVRVTGSGTACARFMDACRRLEPLGMDTSLADAAKDSRIAEMVTLYCKVLIVPEGVPVDLAYAHPPQGVQFVTLTVNPEEDYATGRGGHERSRSITIDTLTHAVFSGKTNVMASRNQPRCTDRQPIKLGGTSSDGYYALPDGTHIPVVDAEVDLLEVTALSALPQAEGSTP
jgi:hypothetical protein